MQQMTVGTIPTRGGQPTPVASVAIDPTTGAETRWELPPSQSPDAGKRIRELEGRKNQRIVSG